PARYVASHREGLYAEQALRIHFGNLLDLATARRQIGDAICVGSVPPSLGQVWDRVRNLGVRVELYERGVASRREQGVDQCLQVHMLRAVTDIVPPQIAVVLTGDGAGYLDGVGYHADLERMAARGWGVEVLSWDIACNGRLRDWARQRGVYIRLEDY